MAYIFQFSTRKLSVKTPVRNIGLQTFLLDKKFSVDNIEWFLNSSMPILGADGKPKVDPQTVFDETWFKRFHNCDSNTLKSLMSK